METSTILVFLFILIMDIFLIYKDIKNKLIFRGNKKFKIVVPVMIIAFIAVTLINNNFRLEDIIVCIEILPLAFVGNKSGITENGFLLNSYVTPWDKIQSYSMNDQGEKFVVSYRNNIGERKVIFKQEEKDDVKKYLLGIKKLRYVRK